jgi:hypothetical protein
MKSAFAKQKMHLETSGLASSNSDSFLFLLQGRVREAKHIQA